MLFVPSGPHTCPFTMVSGLLPTLRPYAYGQVGLCYSKRLDQPDLRAEWCVYLGLESNSPGHHRVFIPARGTIYSRRRFDPQSGCSGQWNYPPRVTTHPSRVLTIADQGLDALRADASEASATLNQPINPAMEHPNARLPPMEMEGTMDSPPDQVHTIAMPPPTTGDPVTPEGVTPNPAPAADPASIVPAVPLMRRSNRLNASDYAAAVPHNVTAFAAQVDEHTKWMQEDQRLCIVANRVSLKRALSQQDAPRREAALIAADKEITQLPLRGGT